MGSRAYDQSGIGDAAACAGTGAFPCRTRLRQFINEPKSTYKGVVLGPWASGPKEMVGGLKQI